MLHFHFGSQLYKAFFRHEILEGKDRVVRIVEGEDGAIKRRDFKISGIIDGMMIHES